MTGSAAFPAETLVAALERGRDLWPEDPAIICDVTGETLTFASLEERVMACARRLHALGIRAGDRVGVCLPNSRDFPIVWLAIGTLRAAMVPINRQYRVGDARPMLEHAGARAVVTCEVLAATFHEAIAEGLELNFVISLDGGDGSIDLRTAEPAGDVEFTPPRPEDTVNIQYSSGTTGKPKGCVLSHRYWMTLAVKNTFEGPEIGRGDVMLTAQPFSYMDPQWNMATAMLAGVPLVVLDGFHPSTFWDSIARYGVTYVYVLGAMPTLLLKMVPSRSEQAHQLSRVYCSAIPLERHRELEERFGVPWYETYGMTEIGGATAVTREDHDELVGTGCIGTPNSFRDVRVVDANDDPVRVGTEGELIVRGFGMMDRYLDDPSANAVSFRNGWFHTGDIVTQDAEGRLFFVGRKKDMIRRGGENIAAAEVEETLQRHAEVRLAACVPVPDALRGEEIWALIVPTDPSSPPDLMELHAFCAANLARFKVPRYWEIRDAVPLTPSHRVQKSTLIAEARDGLRNAFDVTSGIPA
jgi:crotonobetaine/carnitine-CoA ligase